MTFHRLVSHKAWKAPQWFTYLGVFLGSIGLTGTALAWAAIHRQHHMGPDRDIDPHSPNRTPWWRVQFFSMYYRPNLRHVKDLLKKPYIVFFHRYYLIIQLAYAFILYLVDPFAVIYAYLAPAAILWHAGSLINTLGHKFGYRNYKTLDKSVNNLFLGIFMWGEGWHNNHHARPFAKSFKRRFWELDISALIIRMIEQRTKNTSVLAKSK